MAAATPTTHDAIIKHLYPDPNDVMVAMYENNTLFSMLKKSFDGYGKSWHMPVRIAHTAGRSHLFNKAKANKVASNVVEYQISITDNYSLYSVDGRLQRQTSNSKGAFVEAFEFELDSAMDAMKRNFGYEPYLNGGGSIGRFTAGVTLSGTSFTLNNINDIVKFEKNQPLVLSTADGTSGSVKPGKMYVLSVDRDAGTVTVTNTPGGTATAINDASMIPTAAASDFIFTEGDFGIAIKGFEAWVPSTAPVGGDNFFGLDRSQDAVRLAGSRADLRTLGPEEQIQKMCQVSIRNGGKLSHIFENDLDFLALILSLGSRRIVVNTEVDGKVGFEGVKVATGAGTVEVYSDYNNTQGVAWGVDLDKWELKGPGQFPFIDARDGTKLLREDSADAYEGRIIAYYQMISKKVAGSVRGRLT
jgi:hypothetical protein